MCHPESPGDGRRRGVSEPVPAVGPHAPLPAHAAPVRADHPLRLLHRHHAAPQDSLQIYALQVSYQWHRYLQILTNVTSISLMA